MKRYIEQLLEDLEEIRSKAHCNLSSKLDVIDESEYEPYLGNEDEEGIKVAELIGMEQIFLPDMDYLSDFEIDQVVDLLIQVYKAYGLNPIFETCVSNRIKYGHLRHGLSYQVFPSENQIVDIEMCDYLPQYCPLYSLCSHFNQHHVCCERKRHAS